ncbi:TRAP transporter small permease [Calidifontimicrobium sp. SYSU G02091]|uniref:TRAP transporter small permease n=1 Tax=Calidifontimicrobium sp. SYSU G02091 TaxID=2926421 RepID=UPI001F52BB00|nr:TRAP transporter small permease [Calidifontimicrobium sp. SYSU G02091]MCI1190335.1 TRAP transporter small permease [Calidifontimicrobium sp. SYSU G02091]
MSAPTLVERLDAALALLEQVLVVLLTGGITAIMMAQVVLRYFFGAPLFWAEEISVQLLVFASVFGLSLLTRRGDLVSIDFVPRALSPRARHALMAALGAVMLAVVVFVAGLAWGWISRPDVRLELSATTQLPRWTTYAVLPVGLACMAWHQVAAIVRHLGGLRRPGGATG